MRLDQFRSDEEPGKSIKSERPDTDTIAVLKGLQEEMHVTMLQADLIMRRLAQILDKY